MTRSAHLRLAKETLARLGPDDLVEVNGGSVTHLTCVTQRTGLTVCGACRTDWLALPDTAVSCVTRPCH